MASTIDKDEVKKFSDMADAWWDPNGKFKPLHKFNPSRIKYIKRQLESHFEDKKLKIIDIGCGGGLIAEPFARMGHDLTAIDASDKNIKIAQIHAEKSKLKINYINSSAEDLPKKYHRSFDVVFALEIIEHVADVDLFINHCSKLVKPGGLVFIATLNRTLKSLAMAKIGAEYILRWLPIGTHDFNKFLKPSEIVSRAEEFDLELKELKGFEYNIFKDSWKESDNLDINYITVLKK